jgi:hypothetical protein
LAELVGRPGWRRYTTRNPSFRFIKFEYEEDIIKAGSFYWGSSAMDINIAVTADLGKVLLAVLKAKTMTHFNNTE